MWFVHILKGFFGRGFLICPSVLEAPKPVFSLWRLASGVFSFVKDPLSLQLLVLSFLLNFAERHLAAPWTWSGFPSCWTTKDFLFQIMMIIVIPNCCCQNIVNFNFCHQYNRRLIIQIIMIIGIPNFYHQSSIITTNIVIKINLQSWPPILLSKPTLSLSSWSPTWVLAGCVACAPQHSLGTPLGFLIRQAQSMVKTCTKKLLTKGKYKKDC